MTTTLSSNKPSQIYFESASLLKQSTSSTKKGVLKSFANSKKAPVPESFLQWNCTPQPANLLKKRLWHRCLSLKLKILQKPLSDCFWSFGGNSRHFFVDLVFLISLSKFWKWKSFLGSEFNVIFIEDVNFIENGIVNHYVCIETNPA